MDFERFDKLARTDCMALLTALELLWQNGRTVIQSQDVPALTENCVSSIGKFYTAGKLREIVVICKELAGLKTKDLVNYIHRSNLEVKAPGADEEGICPICGGELEYGSDVLLDEGGYREWRCPGCNAAGKEMYDKVFDEHYDVIDGSGKPYPVPKDQSDRPLGGEVGAHG